MTWTMLPQEYHTGACFDLYRHQGFHRSGAVTNAVLQIGR